MSTDFELKWTTPENWAAAPLSDFDRFLQDHAACERKASAVGMSFVVRYPDRKNLLEPMIQFAREELEHFHQVYRVMEKRQVRLCDDEPDPYVNELLAKVRFGREERFMDRLLTSAIIEARGFERLGLVSLALPEGELKRFYERLTRAEGHHKNLFLDLARLEFEDAVINPRLEELLAWEGKIASQLPFRSAVH